MEVTNQRTGIVINSADLESYRSRIEELYSHQNRPLREIIPILQAEGCTASRNMYLKKIARWGLRKYTNHIRQAQNQATTSAFDENRIIIWDDQIQTTINLPARISYSWDDRLFLSLKGTVSRDLIPFAFLSVDMGHPANQPITKLRATITNTFIAEFCSNIQMGVIFFQQGELKLGGASLERGFRAAKNFLLHDSPFIWINLSTLLHQLHNLGFPRVAEMVIKHLFLFSKVLFGPGSEASHFLEALQYCHTRAMIATVAQACSDVSTIVLGPNDPLSISHKYGTLVLLVDNGLSFEEASERYEDILNLLEGISRPAMETKVRKMYSILLEENKFYQKGLGVLLKPVPWIMDQEWPEDIEQFVLNDAVRTAPILLEGLALNERLERPILRNEPALLQCERIYKKLYTIQCSRYGSDSEDATVTKFRLVQFYEKFGDLEGYSEAIDDISKTLETFKLEK